MTDFTRLDRRPLLVAVAGPNGAGKSTFYHAHLSGLALRFVNADVLAAELDLEPYEAAAAAGALRRALLESGESFVFETVFSDPVGDKVDFLAEAAAADYTVVVCFIGISSPEVADQRVAMRVSQGGHDVPREKLDSRYPRTLANLARAIRRLPDVLVYDNEDLARPYRLVAVFEDGRPVTLHPPVPEWLPLLPAEQP